MTVPKASTGDGAGGSAEAEGTGETRTAESTKRSEHQKLRFWRSGCFVDSAFAISQGPFRFPPLDLWLKLQMVNGSGGSLCNREGGGPKSLVSISLRYSSRLLHATRCFLFLHGWQSPGFGERQEQLDLLEAFKCPYIPLSP